MGGGKVTFSPWSPPWNHQPSKRDPRTPQSSLLEPKWCSEGPLGPKKLAKMTPKGPLRPKNTQRKTPKSSLLEPKWSPEGPLGPKKLAKMTPKGPPRPKNTQKHMQKNNQKGSHKYIQIVFVQQREKHLQQTKKRNS